MAVETPQPEVRFSLSFTSKGNKGVRATLYLALMVWAIVLLLIILTDWDQIVRRLHSLANWLMLL